MPKGIESRISALEKAVGRLGASLGKVTATLYGGKDAAPKKARKPRKPRQPRQALGTASAGSTTRADAEFNAGAPGPDDPRYADAGKKRRGRKKADVQAPLAVDAGGEG